MGKPKLLIITGNYYGQFIGGAELQSKLIAERAVSLGWQVHWAFLATPAPFDPHPDITLHPIEHKMLWRKLGNLKYPYAGRLKSLFREIHPDFVYQRGLSALTGLAAELAGSNGCRSTFHIAHDLDAAPKPIPWLRPYRIPETLLCRYGIMHADRIIAQTRFQAASLTKNFARSATVIPNGHPVPIDCDKPIDKVRVLWIANWKPIKRPGVFIDLVRELGSAQAGVRFTMLGHINRNKYGQLVENASNCDIKLPGAIPNEKVNELLANSHLLVNTSQTEGFSNTFIQAWLRRVPVVSLNVDPDNILMKEQIGCCSGNFSQLVRDTNRLIKDYKLRSTMGTKAREYAVKYHSLDNMQKILDILSNRIES